MLLLGENQGEIPKIEKSRSLKKRTRCLIKDRGLHQGPGIAPGLTQTTKIAKNEKVIRSITTTIKAENRYTLLYQLFLKNKKIFLNKFVFETNNII